MQAKIKFFLMMMMTGFIVSAEANNQLSDHYAIITEAPSGNRHLSIPELPSATQKRHMDKLQASGDAEKYFSERFRLVMNKLKKKYETQTFSLKNEILKASDIYQIDPVHILGAIVGEHTFNVDIKDDIQQYAIKLGIWSGFFRGQHPFAEVSKCPELIECEKQSNSYEQWSCYHYNWERQLRNKVACGGQKFPNSSLLTTFFNPTLAGKTYGLGQMGPLTVLALSDEVALKSGFPRLTIHHVDEVYRATLDPRMTVHYIAASIAQSIKTYIEIAKIDISKNPGLTATLYNLGGDKSRARQLAQINKKQRSMLLPLKMPEENYYGWFINKYENELRDYLK